MYCTLVLYAFDFIRFYLARARGPARQKQRSAALAGATFLYISLFFCCVVQLSIIVGEKELKLRQAMTLMGMWDSAYWAAWLLTEVRELRTFD